MGCRVEVLRLDEVFENEDLGRKSGRFDYKLLVFIRELREKRII